MIRFTASFEPFCSTSDHAQMTSGAVTKIRTANLHETQAGTTWIYIRRIITILGREEWKTARRVFAQLVLAMGINYVKLGTVSISLHGHTAYKAAL